MVRKHTDKKLHSKQLQHFHTFLSHPNFLVLFLTGRESQPSSRVSEWEQETFRNTHKNTTVLYLTMIIPVLNITCVCIISIKLWPAADTGRVY